MRRNTIAILKYILLSFLILSFIFISTNLLFPKSSLPSPLQFHKAQEQNVFPQEQPDNAHGDDQNAFSLVDWHNYTQINLEANRKGPGEQGVPLTADLSEKPELDKLFASNGFSGLVSDKISLHRAIPDIRHRDCKSQLYQRALPSVSIIIPFYEEHFTTLLRTVYSCVERAPQGLIKEVILVDDGSSKDFLKKKLEDHVAENFKGEVKVKILRQKEREGLIRTRLLGARSATGDVLLFLDSHCECNVNYLPPLLDPIAKDYRTVMCPFIDVIDHDNFAYRAQDEGGRGAWDWELYYKRLPLLPEDKVHPARPFKSPVMAGGLFAISVKWFWELGGYDPQLEIWGGEQYELSFKIWQCGGRMLDAPCSRIGHIYRKYSPFPAAPGKGDFLARNYKRVAEVWMDEYKEYIYIRRPNFRSANEGDLSEQKALRQRLNCKPFKWFMEVIAFDQPLYYPAVEPALFAEGDIRPVADKSLCIDAMFRDAMKSFPLAPCIRDSNNPGQQHGEQAFKFTFHRDIRTKARSMCFDVPENKEGAPLLLYTCHMQKGNQHFRYHPVTKQIYHVVSNKCLEANIQTRTLMMMPCDTTKLSQNWLWQTITDSNILLKDWP